MESKVESSNSVIISWVNLYSDNLYSWAYYKTSKKELAEDLVQETFLAAFQSIDKFKGESEPKTWLLSILKNKIADHYRKAFRAQDNVSLDDFFDEKGKWLPSQRPQTWNLNEEHLLDNLIFNNTLSGCIDKLPANWNTTFVLRYLEDKKSEDICQDLDITPANFWQIIHRAKLHLRKCLEINWFSK